MNHSVQFWDPTVQFCRVSCFRGNLIVISLHQLICCIYEVNRNHVFFRRHDQVPELDGQPSPSTSHEIVIIDDVFAAEAVAALLERSEVFIGLRNSQLQEGCR